MMAHCSKPGATLVSKHARAAAVQLTGCNDYQQHVRADTSVRNYRRQVRRLSDDGICFTYHKYNRGLTFVVGALG
jgi:hypothetical protein